MIKTKIAEDGQRRCSWCLSTPLYIKYHDEEWGQEVIDDYRLFEKISLEGFQAGLSWITILNKRENFRIAFHQFDFYKIAMFSEKDIQNLLGNEGIIRHRGKIEAVINNAKKAIELIDEFGCLANYFWCFAPVNKRDDFKVRTTSDESIALSKDLKNRGWKFVGPTTMYAFMQAMGLVNDHAKDCFMRSKL